MENINNYYVYGLNIKSEIEIQEFEKIDRIESKDIVTREVLEKSIAKGGTTIHTYTSVDGITGLFQQELLVHGKASKPCPNCQTKIIKTTVNQRGTYYCPHCQK